MEIFFRQLLGKLLITALLCVNSLQAFALDRNEIDEAIDAALSARHPKDDEKFWRGLGPFTVDVILEKIPKTQSSIKKDKLVLALGFFGDDPRAVNYLKKSIESEERVVQKKYLYASYGRALGQYRPDQLGAELKDCFLEKDANTRLVCAQAIKIYDKQDSVQLQDWIKFEKNRWVIDKFNKIKPSANTKLTPVSSTETVFWKNKEGSHTLNLFEWSQDTHQIIFKRQDLKVKLTQLVPVFSYDGWIWDQESQIVKSGKNEVNFRTNKGLNLTEFACNSDWGFF